MRLNLGLESLRPATTTAMNPAAEAFVIAKYEHEIDKCMYAVEQLSTSYLNALEVAKTVKKYGRTQSMISLIGAESIDAAISFEADEQAKQGIWQKIKNALLSFWNMIAGWWNKIIGFIFRTAKYKLDAIDAICKDDKKIANVKFPLTCEALTKRYFDGAKNVANMSLKYVLTGDNSEDYPDLPDGEDVKKQISSKQELQETVNGIRDFLEWSAKNKDEVNKAIKKQIDEIKKLDSSKEDKKEKIAYLKMASASIKKTLKDTVSKAVSSLNSIYAAVKGKGGSDKEQEGEKK